MNFKEMTNAVRFLAVDMIENAGSGHPGIALGFADVASVLFRDFLKFDPADHLRSDRDRLVISAGHASTLLYALMFLTGYKGLTLEDIKSFRKKGSKCSGHPEYGLLEGVESTTGPLGQGLANAVGMAVAERTKGNGNFTYVIAGDGDLMEGISHEAASFAGALGLSRLIVLFDDNHITIDGPTDITCKDDIRMRFGAYNWHYQSIDGHNEQEIVAAISAAQNNLRPSIIACRTTIGYGAPTKAGNSGCHGSPLGNDEVAQMRKVFGWTADPFAIPSDILSAWRQVGLRPKTFATKSNKSNAVSLDEIKKTIAQAKKEFAGNQKPTATRKASQSVINALSSVLPGLIGGSADLTPSNGTHGKDMRIITIENHCGQYIHYGIREHAMGGIMNGLALYDEGIIPYGGTFLCFSDYMRASIRMSAMMKLGVIYVFTHDSIGVGEDGPTHQPIEQLTGLRSIPGINVMRPADSIETAECWELAIKNRNVPSALILSRQDLPPVNDYRDENLCSFGAYVLGKAAGQSAKDRDLTLLATGSEVSLALSVRKLLLNEGINVAVVSMPCCELFDQQSKEYKSMALGRAPVASLEAGSVAMWAKYTGSLDRCIGIDDFGISAPCSDLYEHFGLTPQHIADRCKAILRSA
ncbi:MAG: transketolase [Holosporales bacterium]|jgi:transketolase|nr:transketolase [Holosporales bacterium]